MSQFEKEYHQVERRRASVCLRYMYLDMSIIWFCQEMFSLSPYQKKIGSPVYGSGKIQRFTCTYLQVNKTPHGNRMVIDLFRELDEHPVEVVPNPCSPAFIALLPTALK